MNESLAVLLVEDDEGIRQVLGDSLTDEGWTVRQAADGQEALDLLATWRPDVILLDLMMPRMDGWAFRAAQRTLARSVDLPLIILSANHQAESAAATLGAAAFIAKPFNIDHLVATIGAVARSGTRGS